MKWSLLAVLAVALPSSLAFAPLSVPRTFVSQVISPISTTVRPRSHLGASPLHDISSIILSAADEAAVVAEEAAKGSGNGWFGFLTGPVESLLQFIHTFMVDTLHLTDGAWGWSIVLLTVLIKVATYPLSYTQIESTAKMQNLQPKIKEIQSKYQSNPEVMNQQIASIYQDNEVNPLAGCVPSLIQLPVFIGLYRAVTELAKQDLMEESFLWLPNLEGPTYGVDPAHGSDWILKNWEGLTPSLGWPTTLSYLAIPILLVVSQSISQQLLQPPKSDDPNAPDTSAILKFLPLLIGWFSLNVPAALGVYWVANNFVSTAITLQIKSQFPPPPPAPVGAGASKGVYTPPPTSFTVPVRDKPSGFGSAGGAGGEGGGIKPLTEVEGTTVGGGGGEVMEAEVMGEGIMEGGGGGGGKKRGGKKKKRKNN
ncbi:hypothetical protein TrCOL_g393 [Triparma columacea]|uniref:Membrane insertase YidC/Oxa/ALB C-terminal domain-containing protein n=1 Tax=Triparma columacea TaxID=722753 RepID=A0A9W7LE17_9STRA|nr:hypothetical protein TrCOL_g393 [Triparma columacea]